MSNSPLISIVIPAYNYGAYLEAALQSVLRQSYKNLECIVVDDGSTDDTPDVVQRISSADSRVKYVRQQNSGLSATRNRGLDYASGDFIQFLDADDLLEERKLEVHQRFLQDNPNVDVVFGEAFYFNESLGSPLERFPVAPLQGAGSHIVLSLLSQNNFVVSSPLIRSSLIKRFGGFDTTMRYLEDWDFWLRLAIGGTAFSYLDSPGTATLIRKHGVSMSRNSAKMIEANIDLRQRLMAVLQNNDEISSNKRELVTIRIVLAHQKIDSGDIVAGVKELVRTALPNLRLKSCLYGIYLACNRMKVRQ